MAVTGTEAPTAPRFAPLRRWLPVAPLVLVLVVAVASPLLLTQSPIRVVGPSSAPPSQDFWWGTDSAGMDVYSRTLAATRLNLLIAIGATLVATGIGFVAGLLIGTAESRRDVGARAARATARRVDLVEAVPALVSGLVVISLYGATPWTVTLTLGVILSPLQIRLVRTEVLRVRTEAYLDAARMAGDGEARLTWTVILPNSTWAALENTSFVFGLAIIVTASLGFIGVGLPQPTAEWGSMMARGASDALVGTWWPAAFPAAALAVAVVSAALAARAIFRRVG